MDRNAAITVARALIEEMSIQPGELFPEVEDPVPAPDIVAYRVVSEAPAAEKKDEPWKPGHGEKYYFIGDDWCIFSNKFYDCYPRENACVTAGNCFRTREEAEAKRAEIFS